MEGVDSELTDSEGDSRTSKWDEGSEWWYDGVVRDINCGWKMGGGG